MGQHKTNPVAVAAKRGELTPKPKAVKPLSKREESFLSRWEKVIKARPGMVSDAIKTVRRSRRNTKRAQKALLVEVTAQAMETLRARQKAARKVA